MKEKIGMVLIAVGVLIMLGTAGASDMEVYSLRQTTAWTLSGMAVAYAGSVLVKR